MEFMHRTQTYSTSTKQDTQSTVYTTTQLPQQSCPQTGFVTNH